MNIVEVYFAIYN